MVTVAPGLAGAPALEFAGVSVMAGLTRNVLVAVAVMARLLLPVADTGWAPAATLGTTQPGPVALATAPVGLAVIPQVLPSWVPIVTKTKSLGTNPDPVIFTCVPGVPD